MTAIRGGWRVKTVDGWEIQVRQLRLFRIIEVPVADRRTIGRFWCYDTFEAAVLAAAAWDGSPASEPVGYLRRGGART